MDRATSQSIVKMQQQGRCVATDFWPAYSKSAGLHEDMDSGTSARNPPELGLIDLSGISRG